MGRVISRVISKAGRIMGGTRPARCNRHPTPLLLGDGCTHVCSELRVSFFASRAVPEEPAGPTVGLEREAHREGVGALVSLVDFPGPAFGQLVKQVGPSVRRREGAAPAKETNPRRPWCRL
jgi:hypothetical protein